MRRKLVFLLILSVCLWQRPLSVYSFPKETNTLKMQQGEELFRNKYFQKAFDKYLEIYSSQKSSPVEKEFAHYKMGECLEMAGEISLAIKEFEKMLTEKPLTYKSAVKAKLIQLYPQNDEKAKAERLLKEEIQETPNLMSNYQQLGVLYTEMEEYQKALEVYQDIQRRFPMAREIVEDYFLPLYQKLGLMNQKIEELRAQIGQDPDNDELRRKLTRYYYFLKDYPRAITEYQQIKRRNTDYFVYLGQLYFENQKPQEAVQAWRQIIVKNPFNLDYYNQVVQLLRQAGFLEEVVKVYREARSEMSNPDLYLMELAQTLEVLGDYDGAMREYFYFVSRFPDKSYLAVEAINAVLAEGDASQKIMAAAEKVLQSYPDSVEPHLILGDVYLKQGQAAAAEEHYLTAIRRSVNKEPLIYILAMRLKSKGYYAATLQLYEELPDTNPNTVSPQSLNIADTYLQLGNRATALEILQRVIQRPLWDNMTGEALLMRGRIYYGNAQYEEAIADFKQAIKHYAGGANYEQAQLYIARGYFYSRRYAAAETLVENLLPQFEKGENYYELLYLAAKLKLFLNKKEDSRKALQELAEKYPQSALSNDALALVYFLQHTPKKYLEQTIQGLEKEELGDAEGAIELYLKMLSDQTPPQNAPAIWLRLGNLYRIQRLFANAINAYETVLKNFPDHVLVAAAQLALGDLYAADMQDEKQAVQAYETLLLKYPDSVLVYEARNKVEKLKLHVSP